MKPRAIDLYSGIGGWTLGFKLAGVEMAGSYEYWSPAIQTHEANFDSPVRELKLISLPKKIDFMVLFRLVIALYALRNFGKEKANRRRRRQQEKRICRVRIRDATIGVK